MRKLISSLVLGFLALVNSPIYADKKAEPIECVRLAKTWTDALEEAKVCNVPLIIHSHGFT